MTRNTLRAEPLRGLPWNDPRRGPNGEVAAIPFDTKELRNEVARNTLKALRAKEPKTGDPMKEPPVTPPLNRNPRKHDVVAWRYDSKIDSTSHPTKETALEFGRALPFCTYYKYAVMDGRNLVEKHSIEVPEGLEWLTELGV
jgi:hypothetical protein